MSADLRLAAAAVCFASWLVALFLGVAAAGLVHLLALAGALLVPWRGAAAPHSQEGER